jgi:hypothetical protein
MTIGLIEKDGIVPVNGSFDFNSAPQFQLFGGPHWLSLLAWVDTPDLAATGGLNFQMTHRDPTGADIVSSVIAGNLILNDGTSRFNTAPEMIQRQSATSLWTLDTTIIIGSVGTATVSYRMMVYPIDPSEFGPFG